MIDATIVHVHRHVHGARGGLIARPSASPGGGWTTRIVTLTDAPGNLVRFELLPGHRHDTIGVPPLIEGVAVDVLIADKACDANRPIADLDERSARIVISQRPKRLAPLSIDPIVYGWRHLVENVFCSLEEFERVATRSAKIDAGDRAMIDVAATVLHTMD